MGFMSGSDEPMFHEMAGARPKHRRVQQISSGVEIIELDSDA